VENAHHCLVDGVGSVDIVGLLLDTEPAPHGTTAPHGTPVPVPGEVRQAWLAIAPERVRQTAGAGCAVVSAGTG
jgi:Wax ester synthase-like Acyl-CoA acyltransferase domain